MSHNLAAVTALVHDYCVIRVTIDGRSINAQINPHRSSLVILPDEDIPKHLFAQDEEGAAFVEKPFVEKRVEKIESNVVEEATEIPTKVGLKEAIVGGFKLMKAHFGIDKPEITVFEKRKAICLKCPSFDFGKCTSCGCFLYAKASLVSEKCPLGKWDKV